MKHKMPYRQIHLDFHTSEQIMGVGSRFNAKEFAKTLKDAHVNSINIFGKCHHGMFYYPTKIGTMHPGLDGFNLLDEQLKALREEGIRFTVYTCVGWNEEWAIKNPQWQQRNVAGVVGMRGTFERGYYSWNDLCLNAKDYRQLLKDELKEEYDLFQPAGFWIDIVNQRGCVCDNCVKGMQSYGMDPTLEHSILEYGRMVEMEYCKEMYEYIKSMDPELEVYFNSFPYEVDLVDLPELSSHKKREYFDFIDIESLPSDAWGYTHFPLTVNFLNKYDYEITMMNGKFHMAWGDFGSIRNEKALEYECFRAVANGTKICIGDQLHPTGRLEPAVYERIGKVFESIEQKEPWLEDTKKISDVAVLTTSKTLYAKAMSGNLTDEGAYRVLSEAKIPFDFVSFIDDLDKYKLLILPDSCYINEEYADKINSYTLNGGKVLATGTSGMIDGKFVVESLPVIHIEKSKYDTRYISLADGKFDDIPDMEHVLYLKGEKVKATENGEVFAWIVPPYFNRSYEHFCSHRQTPNVPEISDEPAIVKGENAVYISSPLFSDYAYNGYKPHKDILVECIRNLAGRSIVEADLPALSEVTLREHKEGVVVHTVSYVINRKCKVLDTIEDDVELLNRKYSVYTGFKPSSVTVVPENRSIDFTHSNGYTEYILDYQKGHSMVLIKKN